MSRQYVIVNRDYKMSVGKTAAQVAHAVARMSACLAEPYADTVIVLEATTEQLHNLEVYLTQRQIISWLYIDEGVNEVLPFSATVLAVEPLEDDSDERYIFQDLLLLEDPKWFKRRIYDGFGR